MIAIRKIVLASAVLTFCCDAAFPQGAGFVTLSARLAPNGTVGFGSGVQSAVRSSVGVYVVTFTRSVANCNFLATRQANTPGEIVTAPIVGNPNVVRVRTYNSAGAPQDSGVSLMVNCAS